MARKKDDALHEQRTRQILAAARACFIAKGIHQTTMQEICARGEISPGALYRYFPSKQAIIEALVSAEQQENAELINHLRQARDPAKALADALPEILDHILERDFARLMVEISAEALRNEAVHRIFEQVDRNFRHDLIAIFKLSLLPPGSPVSAQNVEARVFTLLALLDGLAARAAAGDVPDRAPLTKTLQKTVRDLFDPGQF